MDISTYFFPNEVIAQIVIAAQFLFFFYWIISLLRQRSRSKKISSQINSCEEIGDLSNILNRRYLHSVEASVDEMTMVSPKEAASDFENFCKTKQLPEKSPLYKHLKAIFFAGFNESQLNVEALIKNTTSRITSRNASLRSFISLFIILGLFGTLFGLAGSLSELSTILSNAAQLNDEVLKEGLKTLLGKLSGAFAPSIWGVFFTVIGVWLFARYLNRHSFPVLQSLEHQTLINWVPNLIPTPSQRLLAKSYISEKQLQKAAEVANQIGSDTTELGSNIKEASSTLKEFTESAAKLGKYTESFTRNLDGFAQNFKESVEKLSPVTEGLTELYQKILNDSQKFQENVKQTLDDSQTFRGQVQAEFNKQNEQSQMLLNSLKFYENAYIENRQSTDEKIQATLSAAEGALKNLSQQNEIFVKELEVVGVYLRENLKVELVSITEVLNQINSNSTATLKEIAANSTTTLESFSNNSTTALEGFSKNVGDEIQSVAVRLGQLENPIQKSADFIEATSIGFENRTQNFLEEIKREFQDQNQQKENENSNLANLNVGIQTLVNEINVLTGKIEKLNQKDFGQSNFRERKQEKDNPRIFVPKPEQGFFKKLINKFRRKK